MNTISRHNYEEFFLLYVDAELNAEQRAAVELFIEQNPDLAEELEMFRQSTLQADERVFFRNKEELYKTESPAINTTNYEEFFLLYIDNELSAGERAAVETFVLKHPALQQGFSLLKQTVLAPEAIAFGSKDSLYRKEEEERKVMPFNWRRLAVAAAFIGLGIAGLWLFTNTKKQNNIASTGTVAKKDIPVTAKKDTTAVPLKDNGVQQPVEAIDNTIAKTTLSKDDIQKKEPVKIQAVSNQQVADNNITQNDIAVHNTETPVHTNNADEIAAVPVSQDNTRADNSEDNAHAINASISLQNSIEANNQGNNALPLVYKQLDTQQDDRSFYVGALNLNKEKVKGLFRKVGQLFTDKTRSASGNEDDKLQVANLQFETNK